MERLIDVADAETRLAEILADVARGIEITITAGDAPVARIVPALTPGAERMAGLHTGAIRTRGDFDEPLPDSYWAGTG
ncbi:MAG TPA: toxin-antitoxin (TA) system antitoxin [Armatimonadota bacterium]|nr:toxin-antitoxin (TA) system antitoxin [Armatimonadota bacterium]